MSLAEGRDTTNLAPSFSLSLSFMMRSLGGTAFPLSRSRSATERVHHHCHHHHNRRHRHTATPVKLPVYP